MSELINYEAGPSVFTDIAACLFIFGMLFVMIDMHPGLPYTDATKGPTPRLSVSPITAIERVKSDDIMADTVSQALTGSPRICELSLPLVLCPLDERRKSGRPA